MNKINVGDRIRLIKPMGCFEVIGTEFKVSKITDDSIQFNFDIINAYSRASGVGVISYDEFDEYFEKVEENKKLNGIVEVSDEQIEGIIAHVEREINYGLFGNTCTVVTCKLPSGYVISKSVAYNSVKEYANAVANGDDVEKCITQIKNQVKELEIYARAQKRYEAQSN